MIDKRLLDDLAGMASGAMGVVSSLRQQMKDEARGRMDKMANQFDLVTRAEFDKAMGMIAKARAVQEDILKRLDALEGKKASAPKPDNDKAAKKTAHKPAVKRTVKTSSKKKK